MPHDRNDHYWNDHFWSFGSQCCLPNRTSRLCCVLMLLPFFFIFTIMQCLTHEPTSKSHFRQPKGQQCWTIIVDCVLFISGEI